ncbi:PAS domain S-box protein [bacterium]|nr:PAS domain S-box protein [bacterium]
MDFLGPQVPLSLDERLRRVVHPEDLAAVRNAWDQAVATQSNYRVELRLRSRDGQYRWFLSRAIPFKDAQGTVTRWVGTSTDIDDQKQAEAVLRRSQAELERFVQERTKALRESEERYRAVVKNQTELIVRFTPDGTLTFVNEAFCRFFGKTSEELLGSQWHPRVVADDVPLIEERLRSLSRSNPVVVIENRVHSGTGDVHWLQFVNRGLFDAGGSLVEMQTVGRDITERHRLERELLEISEREQRRFGQDLHDGLCQLLVGADCNCEVLERKLAGYAQAEVAEARLVHQSIQEAVTQARALSQGLNPVELHEGGLATALENLAGLVTRLFHVPCVFHQDKRVLIHNPTAALHLYRIAQEAVNNAVKHAQPQHVQIHLHQAAHLITLTVADDGQGLPAGDGKSTGMGLQIMAYRSRVIGATLAVTPGPRAGTVVTCRYPNPA